MSDTADYEAEWANADMTARPFIPYNLDVTCKRTRLGDKVRTVRAQRADGSIVEQVTLSAEEPLELAPDLKPANDLYRFRGRALTPRV